MTAQRTWVRPAAIGVVSALAAALFVTASTSAVQAEPLPACADLAQSDVLADLQTIVTVAEEVTSGGVVNCRIAATIHPTPDSSIGVEYRLPTRDSRQWNGRFLGLGGGSYGGSISASGFNAPLQRGYAVAQTNIGHTQADGVNWSLYPFTAEGPFQQHTDRVIDYTWRSIERMTVIGKAVVAAYYGQAADTSFWQGCSTGGRQGLILAQRFPTYYDGIIAGAPVYSNYQQVRNLWSDAYVHAPKDPATGLVSNGDVGGTPLSSTLRNAVTQHVMGLFDDLDGVADGIINDPLAIEWDPANEVDGIPTIQIDGVPLTYLEVYTILRTYDGPRLEDATLSYPGRVFGSESGWSQLGSHNPSAASPIMFRDMVKIDPFFDHLAFDINEDLDEWDAAFITEQRDASNPDIRPFVDNGGKLLLYHGWNDDAVAPQMTIKYFEEVQQILGAGLDPVETSATTRDDVRLFMVPTMGHCGGGDGPTSFDPLTALEEWYLNDSAPDRIVARNNARDLERPLCVYPKVAVWSGNGSPVGGSLASDFACEDPASSEEKADPTTTAGLNKVTAKQGSAVQYTVQVAADGMLPTGTITVYDGLTALGTVVLNETDHGRARVKLPALDLGVHLIWANYEGDGLINPSHSPTVSLVIR